MNPKFRKQTLLVTLDRRCLSEGVLTGFECMKLLVKHDDRFHITVKEIETIYTKPPPISGVKNPLTEEKRTYVHHIETENAVVSYLTVMMMNFARPESSLSISLGCADDGYDENLQTHSRGFSGDHLKFDDWDPLLKDVIAMYIDVLVNSLVVDPSWDEGERQEALSKTQPSERSSGETQ